MVHAPAWLCKWALTYAKRFPFHTMRPFFIMRNPLFRYHPHPGPGGPTENEFLYYQKLYKKVTFLNFFKKHIRVYPSFCQIWQGIGIFVANHSHLDFYNSFINQRLSKICDRVDRVGDLILSLFFFFLKKNLIIQNEPGINPPTLSNLTFSYVKLCLYDF